MDSAGLGLKSRLENVGLGRGMSSKRVWFTNGRLRGLDCAVWVPVDVVRSDLVFGVPGMLLNSRKQPPNNFYDQEITVISLIVKPLSCVTMVSQVMIRLLFLTRRHFSRLARLESLAGFWVKFSVLSCAGLAQTLLPHASAHYLYSGRA